MVFNVGLKSTVSITASDVCRTLESCNEQPDKTQRYVRN